MTAVKIDILKIIQLVIILTLALALTAVGVNLFVGCGIGSDTFTVLVDGLSRTISVSLGTASFLVNMTLLAFGLLLNRKLIGITSILNGLFIGSFIDLVYPIISGLSLASLVLPLKVMVVLLANLCFSLSFALLIKFGNGMHPIDAILYFVQGKVKLPYTYGRIILDGIFLTSGFLLGGIIGIGTVIALIATGPGTSVFMRMLNKFFS